MLRIALLMSFVLGFLDAAVAQTPKTDQLQIASTIAAQGRYQIIMSPHVARDTFLLDTETGRVWQLTVFSFLNDDPVVWNAMPKIDNSEDYAKVVADHGRKPRQAPPPR